MTSKIRRVLIANRGEVAVRITAALRDLGISPIIIFTEPDRGAFFTTVGDCAICVGGPRGYLDVDAVIAAAKQARADAIHPGYGFLSENPRFAEAVANAGLIFIGPPAATIAALGSKIGAKHIIARAAPDVPLIPGFFQPPADASSLSSSSAAAAPLLQPHEWREKAASIGFPLLIKAAAGGGGKGMRVVRKIEEFDGALESVRVEARGAFGDETILLERYFESVRHIEVQVFGDAHGNVVHLFERECSVQRRHQKLVEECPSPALTPETRERICNAAVAVAKSVNYCNAGTVEFIYENTGNFYFLEVNTRLQVEHGVTELCTNVDIVKTQIFVASGCTITDALMAARINPALPPLPPQPVGSSIEVRVYAEDDNFAPCVGAVSGFELDPNAKYHCSTTVGSTIGVAYDGLIAKVIVHAGSRDAAILKLVSALKRMIVFGVRTNRRALINLLLHERVFGGNMATDLIDRGIIAPAELTRELPAAAIADPPRPVRSIVAAALVASREATSRRKGPWGRAPPGWCNAGATVALQSRTFVIDEQQAGTTYTATVAPVVASAADSSFFDVTVTVSPASAAFNLTGARLVPLPATAAQVAQRGFEKFQVEYRCGAAVVSEHVAVQRVSNRPVARADKPVPWESASIAEEVFVHHLDCGNFARIGIVDRLGGLLPATVSADQGDSLPASYSAAAAGAGDDAAATGAGGATAVRAPIPAKIVKVNVASGAQVKKGDVVVILESMKMETKLAAPRDGVVKVLAAAGDTVASGKIVFTIS